MLLRGITVLLVEDDPDNLELLAAYFEAEGARALGASSVAGALKMANVARVDVVVSDLELADGDGCDIIKQLREREGMSELPAIAITGFSDQKWRDKAASCGFNRYAVKPFSLGRLVEWIAELSGPATSGVRAEASRAEQRRAARGRLAR